MIRKLKFRLIFCFLLIQLSAPQILLGMELFSFSYGDEGLKANVLSLPVYDEEALKKENEDLKNIQELTQTTDQKINKTDQKINKTDQKINEAKQRTKEIEEKIKEVELTAKKASERIRIKTTALKKALEEL